MWPPHPRNTTTLCQSVRNDISLHQSWALVPEGQLDLIRLVLVTTNLITHTHILHFTTAQISYNPGHFSNRSFLSVLVKKYIPEYTAVHQSSLWPAVQWEAEWQSWPPPPPVDLTTLASLWQDDWCPVPKEVNHFPLGELTELHVINIVPSVAKPKCFRLYELGPRTLQQVLFIM